MTLPIRNSRIRLSQGQLFCREIGSGKAFLFLHGNWQDGSQWLSVMDLLGSRHHCFAPDLLGCGDSERPNIHYSIEVLVESLAEYLEAVKVRDIWLVGHEVGGWVAAAYALRYPEQVRGLVLIGAEGATVRGVNQRWFWERWLIARFSPVPWVLRSLFPIARLIGRHSKIKQLLALQKQLKRSPAVCQLLFNRRQAVIQAELLNDRIAWLKMPILILQGERDRSIATAFNQVYAQAPHAKLHLISDADENLVKTMPDRLAQEIQDFLRISNQ